MEVHEAESRRELARLKQMNPEGTGRRRSPTGQGREVATWRFLRRHHLRSLSSELAHVAEALLDDLRRAVDSVSPRHTSSSVQRITVDLSSRVHEFFHSVTMALDSYDANSFLVVLLQDDAR